MNDDFKIRIRKRNKKFVDFDSDRIKAAITKAKNDLSISKANDNMNDDDIAFIVKHSVENIKNSDKIKTDKRNNQFIEVEDVQDIVENTLIERGFIETAKKYIRYREIRAKRREANESLMNNYNDLLFAPSENIDLKRDNANINCDAPMGIMLKIGAEGAKNYLNHYVLDSRYKAMHMNDIVHIHDADFSLITFNCCQIDLLKLFKGGFSTGHGFLREPNCIRSAAALACIAVQSNQNDQFGG